MLRLYWADVSRLKPDASDYALSDYRREKLRRLRPESARRESIGAELLLRLALAELRPDQPWPPRITTGEQGKPGWDVEGLYFSLSHSGGIAVCAVADLPVGVDVQAPCACREALARRFFAPAEQAALAEAEDRDEAFGRIWCRKEAYLKALGMGMTIPLGSFSAVGETPPGACFWDVCRDGWHLSLCLPCAESAEPDRITEKKLP